MSNVRNVIETLFQIYDKNNELVPFKFNSIQARIDLEIIEPIEKFRALHGAHADIPESLRASIRNSILKYRQGGVTTLIVAWFLVECMYKYAVVVMLTHDKEHSEKLLYRARLMLKNLKGPKPKFSKLNDNEIAFEKTQSVFYIGTAGSKEFGRSATITFLHCSEIAFWKDPASLMKSLFQAVPKHTGVIIHETTANGWGNWYQKSYYNYLTGKGGFRPFFFPWYIHEEYFSYTPIQWHNVNEVERGYECALYRRIRRALPSLTRVQILAKLQWRREKIDENQGDRDREAAVLDFNQEYPSTHEEAFILSGGSMFQNARYTYHPEWKNLSAYESCLTTHPRPEFTYSLGADYAGGTGGDYSSIVILCVETQETVYTFHHNRINPIDFSDKITSIGFTYNTALLVPEVNAHGLAGVALIKRTYPLVNIYKHILPHGESNQRMNIPSYGYGWKTTATSKPYMIGVAQRFTYLGWKLYDATLVDELKSFQEDQETGRMEGIGDHDDLGIAFMLACLGVLKLLRFHGTDLKDLEEVDLTTLVEHVKPVPVPTLPTWRDPTTGAYCTPFQDMFATKQGHRLHHV